MESANKQIKIIVFEIQNEEYALPVESVSSIERMHPITRVPDTPHYVRGVINLRGVITPIIDLRLRFGLDAQEPTDDTRIIIVEFNDMEIGLIVDAALDVIDLPLDLIESNPEVVQSEQIDYISGVAKVGSRLLILLNLSRVLDLKENEELLETEG